jgi:hypothetical protein
MGVTVFTDEPCARCGRPERGHQYPAGTTAEEREIWAALGGPCENYAVKRSAVRARALAKSRILCHRCFANGHTTEACPY